MWVCRLGDSHAVRIPKGEPSSSFNRSRRGHRMVGAVVLFPFVFTATSPGIGRQCLSTVYPVTRSRETAYTRRVLTPNNTPISLLTGKWTSTGSVWFISVSGNSGPISRGR